MRRLARANPRRDAAWALAAWALAALALIGPAVAARPQRRGDTEIGRAEPGRADTGRVGADRAAAARLAALAAGDEQRLAALRVESAARLREAEDDVAARAAETEALAGKRDAAAAKLARRSAGLAPLLPLMERLALFPAETLLALPGAPGDALLGLGILRGVARGLEQEARALRQEQAALEADRRAVEESLPRLREAQAKQAARDQALEQRLAAARGMRLRADEGSRRAEAEAARAETLRAAILALEAERARAEAQARTDETRAERLRQERAATEARQRQAVLAPPQGAGPEPRGQLMAPVAGSVMRGWGEATEAGPASGMSYRPPPQARVVAPCGGRVRFAGPFRSYGVLVILDCGGGYAFVLAGLARLDVAAGGAVLAGEPVGVMPDWSPAAGGSHPALYVELRRDGVAVNPAPFLRGGALRG